MDASELQSISGSLETLQNETNTLKETVSTLNTTVGTLSESIEGVKTSLANYVTVNTYNTDMANITEALKWHYLEDAASAE